MPETSICINETTSRRIVGVHLSDLKLNADKFGRGGVPRDFVEASSFRDFEFGSLGHQQNATKLAGDRDRSVEGYAPSGSYNVNTDLKLTAVNM